MQRRGGEPAVKPRPFFPLFAALAALPFASAHARDIRPDWSQDGQASYYGNHWVGHRTTSGARFDQKKLTCAHASLPLGTRLLVTADATGDSVIVTVNDREPDHGHRIIDLSQAAARRLHMLHSGIAEVTISPATVADISANDAEQDDEVAEAPDTDDPAVAAIRSTGRHGHVSHARHDRRQTRHVPP